MWWQDWQAYCVSASLPRCRFVGWIGAGAGRAAGGPGCNCRIVRRRHGGQHAKKSYYVPDLLLREVEAPCRHAAHLDPVSGNPVHLTRFPAARCIGQRAGHGLHAQANDAHRHARPAVALLAMGAKYRATAGSGAFRNRRRHDAACMEAHRLLHASFNQRVHELEVRPQRGSVIPAGLQDHCSRHDSGKTCQA